MFCGAWEVVLSGKNCSEGSCCSSCVLKCRINVLGELKLTNQIIFRSTLSLSSDPFSVLPQKQLPQWLQPWPHHFRLESTDMDKQLKSEEYITDLDKLFGSITLNTIQTVLRMIGASDLWPFLRGPFEKGNILRCFHREAWKNTKWST